MTIPEPDYSLPLTLNQLAADVHAIARSKGFWDGSGGLREKLLLVVCEVAEATEILRNHTDVGDVSYGKDGKPAGFRFELADIIIRVLDIGAHYDLDLEQAVSKKMAYNRSRPSKHNKLFGRRIRE